MAMPSAFVTSAVLGLESIDQPTTLRNPGIEDGGAVHLALSRRMLGDVGDPQLIGLVAMKLPVDTVAGGGHPWDVAKARAPRDSLNPSASHQHLDRLVTDGDALSEDQVGMDTPDAVGSSRDGVHLADHVGEPDMADRAG